MSCRHFPKEYPPIDWIAAIYQRDRWQKCRDCDATIVLVSEEGGYWEHVWEEVPREEQVAKVLEE